MKAITPPPTALVLVCDSCGRPIEDGAGSILLRSAEGGYPHAPSAALDGAFRRELVERYGERLTYTLGQHFDAERAVADANPPQVTIDVLHDACSVGDDTPAYVVDLRRCSSAYEVLDWVDHLAGKTWFGARDMRRLIRRLLGRHEAP
jgi:hypothetical protein